MITLTQPTRRTRKQSLSWRLGADILPEFHKQSAVETIDSKAHDAAVLGLVEDMTTLHESYCAPINSPFTQSPFTRLPMAHGYDFELGQR